MGCLSLLWRNHGHARLLDRWSADTSLPTEEDQRINVAFPGNKTIFGVLQKEPGPVNKEEGVC